MLFKIYLNIHASFFHIFLHFCFAAVCFLGMFLSKNFFSLFCVCTQKTNDHTTESNRDMLSHIILHLLQCPKKYIFKWPSNEGQKCLQQVIHPWDVNSPAGTSGDHRQEETGCRKPETHLREGGWNTKILRIFLCPSLNRLLEKELEWPKWFHD